MTVEFECRESIAAPVEVVFDLSLDIGAHLASMAESGEQAIGGVTSGLIGLGETVTWRAKHFWGAVHDDGPNHRARASGTVR